MVSTRGKQTRADANRNRDAIIEASLRVIGGNPRASVADVAAAAGISRGTLYAHFPSRRALVDAAFRRAMSLLDRESTKLDPALTAWESMEHLVGASSWVLGRLPNIASAAAEEVGSAQLERMNAESLESIKTLLERGRAASAFRTDQDVRWQAQCVLAIAQAGASRVQLGCPQLTVTGYITSTVLSMLEAEREGSA